MPRYHLLSTRRNSDGSFDTPSLDEVVAAADDQSAARQAARFPLHAYGDAGNVAWLVDEAGNLIWTMDLPEAA